jgi:hypothetical protein
MGLMRKGQDQKEQENGRSHIIAHPAYSGLRRWASEDSVSTIPCHPSYMASGFLPWAGLSLASKQHPLLGRLKY